MKGVLKIQTKYLNSHSERAVSRPLLLLFVALVAALIPMALLGWKQVYGRVLERTPPVIQIVRAPRGIGLTPVRFEIEIQDENSGLDEVVVRTIQRDDWNELKRQSLSGEAETRLSLQFNADQSGLDEGEVVLQIKAFDRSIWSNGAERSIPLRVDFREPSIEVISTQHNARVGGSQLIIYRASDEALGLSGVKVGRNTFLGFKASLFDPEFRDSGVFAALYAIPVGIKDVDSLRIRAFAEDEVGNAVSTSFYHKVFPRRIRPRRVRVSETFLRTGLTSLIRNIEDEFDLPEVEFRTTPASPTRFIEAFTLANGRLRELSEARLSTVMNEPRFKRFWDASFLTPGGTVRYGFGEGLTYFFGEKVIGQDVNDGYTYLPRAGNRNVYAAASGVVTYAESLGVYGTVVVLDHGLGVFTVYAHLGSTSAVRGEVIEAGEKVGTYGTSGLAENEQVHFQVNVQGTPVDPAEFLSETWFQEHITFKLNDAKRALGIERIQPF